MTNHYSCSNKDCSNFKKEPSTYEEEFSSVDEHEYIKQLICPECKDPMQSMSEGE